MQSTTNNDCRITNTRLADFPTLASLRLTMADLDKLARQGFVCEERRGDRSYHKLRFRSGEKQVVRYIGDSERAAAVERELTILQKESKTMRELRAKTKVANKAIREARNLMEPLLKANGFAFHGLAIRRRRRRCSETSNYSKS